MTLVPKNRVLAVVEDEEDIRELVVAYFRTRNFRVEPFTNPTSFLEDLEAGKLSPDVILTDFNLPEIDGIELVKRLKDMACEAPVILLTGERSAETAIRAIEAGAYDFVVKPMNFPQLQVSVDRAVHFRGIREENKFLRAAVSQQQSPTGIIGKSPGLRRAVDLARRVSSSSANVFISGETGSGKEVIARAVHDLGERAKQPFIAINCSAIPESLLESELFGHAKGSFTGASEKKIGLFEEAGAGTLFLDEVGDLSLPLQAKLLRTLQERKIKRIGENQFRPIQARIISATHKNLREEVREKRFREDLFFRLNVIPIDLSPLRDRREDIIPLAEHFLRKFCAANDRSFEGFEKGAIEYLLSAPWPGNVRELENAIERAVVLAEGTKITLADLSFLDAGGRAPVAAPSFRADENAALPRAEEPARVAVADAASPDCFAVSISSGLLTVDEVVNQYIAFAISRNGGAKDRTARELGIDRKTIYRRCKELAPAPVQH